jgi:DHA1 family bicyclomycin/chloramphenicol resistance-like MFS transporter
MNKNNSNYTFLYVTLGLLTAFGPFVTDFYLPALPSIANYFETNASMVQMSLTMGMLGLAIGQIIIGPLSDRYGRRLPLLASMVAFIVATVACIFAPSIGVFNTMRFFQGLTAAGGIVLARSIATDLYSGSELTRFIAIMSAVNGVAPVASPVIGGILLKFTSWKGTYIALLCVGIALTAMCTQVRESLTMERRSTKRLLATFTTYVKVFRNPKYMAFLMAYAFSMAVLFSYISSSPFVLQDGYGLSPIVYSLCFGINALAIGIGCALAAKVKNEYAWLRRGGVLFVGAAALVAVALIARVPVYLLEPTYILLMFMFGTLQPTITAIVLDSERDNAGTASAALGASGFLFGSIASPLTGIGDVSTTSALLIFVTALTTAVLLHLACRRFAR